MKPVTLFGLRFEPPPPPKPPANLDALQRQVFLEGCRREESTPEEIEIFRQEFLASI